MLCVVKGIKQDGVEFAARRHFTSKITSTKDLATLSTYGFRGEALSSLCHVADVILIPFILLTSHHSNCFVGICHYKDRDGPF